MVCGPYDAGARHHATQNLYRLSRDFFISIYLTHPPWFRAFSLSAMARKAIGLGEDAEVYTCWDVEASGMISWLYDLPHDVLPSKTGFPWLPLRDLIEYLIGPLNLKFETLSRLSSCQPQTN